MTKDIESLKYYSVPSLPCSLLSRFALRPTRVPEPHVSVCGTEVLPTVDDDRVRDQMSKLDIVKSQGQMHLKEAG